MIRGIVIDCDGEFEIKDDKLVELNGSIFTAHIKDDILTISKTKYSNRSWANIIQLDGISISMSADKKTLKVDGDIDTFILNGVEFIGGIEKPPQKRDEFTFLEYPFEEISLEEISICGSAYFLYDGHNNNKNILSNQEIVDISLRGSGDLVLRNIMVPRANIALVGDGVIDISKNCDFGMVNKSLTGVGSIKE